MAFLPDILDGLGKTPREEGAVQVHLEQGIVRRSDRIAAVILNLQAAFEPWQGGSVVFAWGEDPRARAEEELPALADGRAVRWTVRLPDLGAAERVWVEAIRAPVPPKATRVRPAWKLSAIVSQGGKAQGRWSAGSTLGPLSTALVETDFLPELDVVTLWKAGQPVPGSREAGEAAQTGTCTNGHAVSGASVRLGFCGRCGAGLL